MEGNALVITQGFLDKNDAKTAHGLIRGTKRYNIVGVLDKNFAGRDAGEVLDGKKRGIPVFKDLEEALSGLEISVHYGIIGVATHGGYLPESLLKITASFLEKGISMVNGLHDFISNKPEMVRLAKENKAYIIDIRKPKEFKDLHFWSGKIKEVTTPKIAVLGTDCAVGKRTTAAFLANGLNKKNIHTEMLYTGQTGWLQGHRYGFIFDATPNDFISGEIEHSIYTCYKQTNPKLILVEGQSSLRNPSGPCGSEFLISGQMDGVILQHQLSRVYFDNDASLGKIPELSAEIDLIKMYGVETMAICLNTNGITLEQAKAAKEKLEQETKIPVVLPLEEGVGQLIDLLCDKFEL